MAFVEINPCYRELLARQGINTAADFFDWQGVFIGGHADRHIARVTLGEGQERITAYLKREERVRWRHRLRSLWEGLGFVSRCCREARLLDQLRQAGIDCPQVIAAGESEREGAFLLVRHVENVGELRHCLNQAPAGSSQRRALAIQLGRSLAKLHAAGFYHGDLYAKHVLVRGDTFALVDWQRAHLRRRFSWRRACRDLAALDATLADELATSRDRLTCLSAYLRQARSLKGLPGLRSAAAMIRRKAAQLLRSRRISEMRQPPLSQEQALVRTQTGLSLTRQFRESLSAGMPVWLRLSRRGEPPGRRVTHVALAGAGPRGAALVRCQASQPLRWLWSWLRGKPLLSAEVLQAGILFRLERYGIHAPRLLAFGQQAARPWQVRSLLLMEAPQDGVTVEGWLRWSGDGVSAQRRRVLQHCGDLLRRLHAAACYLPEGVGERFRVQSKEQVVLADIGDLRRQHRPSKRLAVANLASLHARFARLCSRPEGLRFLLAYLGQRRLTPEARRLVRRVMRRRPSRFGRAVA